MTAERHLEEELIQKLADLKYEVRKDIRDRETLEANFREKFESLNHVKLTDAEFKRLLEDIISVDTFAAAKTLRSINTFFREDGTPLHFMLVNLKDWCRNTFEVIHQLKINTDYSHHRYDVILLVNGIPLVQVELKTLGINPRKAMEQIVEYKNDPGNGYLKTLLCFVQIFVASNRTDTWYFANNNARHFAFNAEERFLPVYQFADPDNKKVVHLEDFAEKFLAKCTLAQMISKYMVLVESEQKLLMMRPYQIYAVRAIVDCIHHNRGNGYIWHTTGSGKTLTSFKASTLLKTNPDIEKCIFVVDRKDLDRQTREEFNRFQEDCVEENANTAALVDRLLSSDTRDKVIVCTIQKLGLALDPSHRRKHADRLAGMRNKRVVFIFDECHRSQFGENHQAIRDFFPQAQLFGFTGTPIFEENATVKRIEENIQTLHTTVDLFDQELHAYTITHAIEDGNVLRFHVDYYGADGRGADGREAPAGGEGPPKRKVVEEILSKHDTATGQRRFNALFATSSIGDAIEYMVLFDAVQRGKAQQDPHFKPLNIACVFSPPNSQLQEDLDQEKEDYRKNPKEKKLALERIIEDYNTKYGTNHSVDDFDLYYQDVQKRIKDQQYPNADYPHHKKIDITIVVDMLLTGFDSKYLNTLYVAKKLKYHGLIQAFSRTNRILNATKPYGTIIDFLGQKAAVDAAIMRFSGAPLDRARQIWLVDNAPVVLEKFKEAKAKLDKLMKSHGVEPRPEDVKNLKGDDARIAFIESFKEVQRWQTQLDQYTDLTEAQKREITAVLPKDDLRAFRGAYLETAKRLREQRKPTGGDGKPADETVDYELVLFASALIDYDYIMGLASRYTQQDPKKVKMTPHQIIDLFMGDSKFIDDREALSEFVLSLQIGQWLDEKEVRARYQAFKAEREQREVRGIADQHGLEPEILQSFVEEVLGRRIFDGERLTELMNPKGLGWRARVEKELALMADLEPLLKRRAGPREIAGLRVYEAAGEYGATSTEEDAVAD